MNLRERRASHTLLLPPLLSLPLSMHELWAHTTELEMGLEQDVMDLGWG